MPQRACAQEDDVDPAEQAFARGTQAFRNIIYGIQKDKMKVLKSAKDLRDGTPKETLIIIYGDTPSRVLDRLDRSLGSGGLGGFVAEGGALLVASDEHSEAFQDDFGVTINGALLHNDKVFYRTSAMPIVQPVEPVLPDASPEVPIFPGLDNIATNRPTIITFDDRPPLRRLAKLPKETKKDEDGQEVLKLTFAVGGKWKSGGRALFLADHSLFINGMLLQDDNDNAVFAQRSLEWLMESKDGPRNRLLYLENGVAVTDLNVPLEPGFRLDEQAIDEFVAGLNGLIAEQEQQDSLNRLMQRVAPRTWVAIVFIVGSVVLLLVLVQRLSARRYRHPGGVDLLTVASLRHGPSRVPQRDRATEMVREGNFSDAARGVVRQFFQEQSGTDLSSTHGPPTVRSRGRPDLESRI